MAEINVVDRVQCLECSEILWEDEIVDSVIGQICPYCGERSSFATIDEEIAEVTFEYDSEFDMEDMI